MFVKLMIMMIMIIEKNNMIYFHSRIKFHCHKFHNKRNSKIPKGQTEIVKSEDSQDHGQQNETKDKLRTHNTTLKTKAGVTRNLQKPGEFRCSGRVSNSYSTIDTRRVTQ